MLYNFFHRFSKLNFQRAYDSAKLVIVFLSVVHEFQSSWQPMRRARRIACKQFEEIILFPDFSHVTQNVVQFTLRQSEYLVYKYHYLYILNVVSCYVQRWGIILTRNRMDDTSRNIDMRCSCKSTVSYEVYKVYDNIRRNLSPAGRTGQ